MPEAFYFGCWNRPGHYFHDAAGRTVWTKPEGIPWQDHHMDATLLRNGNVPDAPDGRVFWTCGGAADVWFAFFWWDRSGDRRGASNSGFYVRGVGDRATINRELAWEWVQEAFKCACEAFPKIVQRQRFPLALQSK